MKITESWTFIGKFLCAKGIFHPWCIAVPASHLSPSPTDKKVMPPLPFSANITYIYHFRLDQISTCFDPFSETVLMDFSGFAADFSIICLLSGQQRILVPLVNIGVSPFFLHFD